MTKVSIKTAVLQARAAALVAAALVFAVASVVTGPKQTPKLVLAQSIGFKVAGTISSSSPSQIAALLHHGVRSDLWYASAGSSVGHALAQSPPRLPASVSLSLAEGAPLAVPVITKAPESLTYDTSAHLGYIDQGQHDGFQCRLDNAAFAPCGSEGVTYDHLALGPHCFEVLAVHGGLRSAPTSFCWRCRPVAIRGEFTIGGNTAQLFYPGTSQVLDLSITNPFKVAIKVLSVSITVDPSSTKSGCRGSVNLLVTQPLRATLAVPADSTKSLSQLGVLRGKWPVLTMPDLPVNQDACEGATLTLVYHGTAAQL